MEKKNRNVFWQALLAAAFIFGFGMILGIALENYRTNKISDLFAASEIDLLDARIQNQIYQEEGFDCESAISENIKFADRIFEEAQQLDRGKSANKLTDSIIQEHKKYDLLRVLFWMNSIHIKEECGPSFHTIVYIYDFQEPGIEKNSQQRVFSNILKDLKEKRGSDIMLIPIAGDNNLTSVDLMRKKYEIEQLPTILIDEEIKVEELQTLEELENLIIEKDKNPFSLLTK